MPDGSVKTTEVAVGLLPDVDRAVWHASSALYDLCQLLSDRSAVRTIRESQLKDLDVMVCQAMRAKALASRIDLPAHEFNA